MFKFLPIASMQNSWSIKIFQIKHATNHVSIITTLFIVQQLLVIPHKVVAQTGGLFSPPPPPPPSERHSLMDNPLKVSPGMAILFVSLVATFFIIGCLSIYARRCMDILPWTTRGRGIPMSYINGQFGRRRQGIDSNVIDKFPTFLYSDIRGLRIGKVALECAVCLNEFEDNSMLRLLPKCCHVFHPECIDTWLAFHVTCPVCRADLVPVLGEEVIDYPLLEKRLTSELVCGSTHSTRSNEISELAIDIGTITSPIEQICPPKGQLLDCKVEQSNSTDQDIERFTLRLPEGIHRTLKASGIRRVASNAALPTVRSPKRWFRRSTSFGIGRGRNNNVCFERFDRQSRSDRSGFSIITRSKSVQSFSRLTGNNPV